MNDQILINKLADADDYVNFPAVHNTPVKIGVTTAGDNVYRQLFTTTLTRPSNVAAGTYVRESIGRPSKTVEKILAFTGTFERTEAGATTPSAVFSISSGVFDGYENYEFMIDNIYNIVYLNQYRNNDEIVNATRRVYVYMDYSSKE